MADDLLTAGLPAVELQPRTCLEEVLAVDEGFGERTFQSLEPMGYDGERAILLVTTAGNSKTRQDLYSIDARSGAAERIRGIHVTKKDTNAWHLMGITAILSNIKELDNDPDWTSAFGFGAIDLDTRAYREFPYVSGHLIHTATGSPMSIRLGDETIHAIMKHTNSGRAAYLLAIRDSDFESRTLSI